MKTENERLLTLVNDQKITENEYHLLSKALAKNTGARRIFSLLVNPYQKIAGIYALIIGIGIIFTMSYLGSIASIYFPGLLDILNASMVKNPHIRADFLFLLYQNTAIWLVLTMLFFVSAKIFQKKNTRIIDFMGTVALSRFPYLLLTAFLALMRVGTPQFMDIGVYNALQLNSFLSIVFSAIVMICAIWHIAMYWYALKESSGLQGKKLWIGFIACILIGEILTNFITMAPMSK